MFTSTRLSVLARALLSVALLSLAACGDDSASDSSSSGTGGDGDGDGDGDGGGAGQSCGTVDDPVLFELADITPAAGSVVDGLSVVHSFRVVDAPASVNQLTFQVAATHTAGTPTPAQLVFNVQQDGKDLVYTAGAVEWANAGHVELSIPTKYEGQGCVYAFPPSPLFSYDLEDGAGGGSTGSTGSTGAGGDAGAGGADGG